MTDRMRATSDPPVGLPNSAVIKHIAAAVAAAAAILVVAVLPAEYHIDPTGFGTLSGLMALSEVPPPDAPADTGLGAAPPSEAEPARSYELPFRTDEVPIRLGPFSELEYKVRMQPGGTLVFSWKVDEGTEVFYDFHGAPTVEPTKEQSYDRGVATEQNGSLIAPFAGIHGWFLQNQEDKPIIVRVRMSGFYELREALSQKSESQK